jgi:hypothetical protein
MERLSNRRKSPWLAAPPVIDSLLSAVTNTQLVEGRFFISFILFPNDLLKVCGVCEP